MRPARKRIAVLVSGRGSNLAAMLRNDCGGDVVVVGSNKADAAGLELARDAGVATIAVNHKDYADRESFDAALVTALNRYQPDLVVLAGFMRILTPVFVDAFAGRLMNIHPSLLPSFAGLDTHARALAAGVKLHGCTVHFVTNELDHGPIIMQAAVQVDDDDTPETLATKVLVQEHQVLPYAVRLFCEGRLVVEGMRVRTRDCAFAPSPAQMR
ncbi:MAG: phosphoribosylglycinamide formyltransferase [Burkholderiales bacterium]|nr:phosphoribosylglycinamide formyltransferase [Burkholderiales bacterium]